MDDIYIRGLNILGSRTTLGPRGQNIVGYDWHQLLNALGIPTSAPDPEHAFTDAPVNLDPTAPRWDYYHPAATPAAAHVNPVLAARLAASKQRLAELRAKAASSTVLGDFFEKQKVLDALHSEIFGVAVKEGVDVDALVQRFDTLPSTNRTVWSLWVENGHGIALAQRVAQDAQNILNRALVPTNEFSFHDATIAFAKRAEALSNEVTKQPLDDNPSPIWNKVKQYFVDGSKLANTLEDVLSESVKWSDVKEAMNKAAQGLENIAKPAADAIKWTYWIAVAAGVGILGFVGYGAYRRVSGR